MHRGKFAFQNRLGKLIAGGKFAILALFYFVFEGKFQVQAPQGAYLWRGDVTEGFFALRVWGACIWRGLHKEGLILGILHYFLKTLTDVFCELLVILPKFIKFLTHHESCITFLKITEKVLKKKNK